MVQSMHFVFQEHFRLLECSVVGGVGLMDGWMGGSLMGG